MPPRRRIDPNVGRAALNQWRWGEEPTSREDLATAVRFTLEELADQQPGRSVEIRVPPFGAVQCIPGPIHRRGTPPNTVETDAQTWLGLAVGDLDWADAVADGVVRWSGIRAELADYLPFIGPDSAHSPG